MIDGEYDESLVTDNMRLVNWLAYRYYGPKLANDDDFIAEGYLGLVKAAKSFDSDISKFSTYATKVVCNQFNMYLRKVGKFKAGNLVDNTLFLSLNEHVYDDKGDHVEVENFVADSKNDFDDCITYEMYEKFLKSCTDRELEIIHLMYKNYTQRDIGRKLHISQSYVSRIIRHMRERDLIE